MTTIDEVRLREQLRAAGEGFAVSSAAFDEILLVATDEVDGAPTQSITTLYHRLGRGRSALLSAAAALIVLAVAVPLVRHEGGSGTNRPLNAISSSGKKFLSPPPASGALSVQGTGFGSGAPGGVSAGSSTTSSGQGGVTSATSTAATPTPTTGSSLRVERTGTLALTVGDHSFGADVAKLTKLATSDGGFVANSFSHVVKSHAGSYSTGYVVLDVPVATFSSFVVAAQRVGLATSVQTSSTDVTGQYVDLQARIAALDVSRTQYLKIMTRTTSIDGILAVQRQLNNIQSDIEQDQGQLNLLTHETSYATLTVSLSEAGHAPVTTVHRENGVKRAVHDSVGGFVSGVEWLIRLAGPLVFGALLLAALLLLGRLSWLAVQRRR